MTAIGKGDWVECVKNSPRNTITAGSVYYCVAVVDGGPYPCSGCGCVVDVIRVARKKHSYCPCLFRPLRKPPAESQDLTAKIKEGVGA